MSSFFKLFFIATLFLSMPLYAQDEGFEEPLLESPTDFGDGVEIDEEEVMNQLDQMNEASSDLDFKSFIYSEKGRRDPFSKPPGLEETKDQFVGEQESQTGGLEGYDVSSFQLTTVLWDVKHPKALVRASDTETFVIEEGTKIGRSNGYVAKIREGEVVIVEPALSTDPSVPTLYKTQVLKLGR